MSTGSRRLLTTVFKTPPKTPQSVTIAGAAGSPGSTPAGSAEEASPVKTTTKVLATTVLSGYLGKQKKKTGTSVIATRLFTQSTFQKRFFVLTSHELAYRDKEDDVDVKQIWTLVEDVKAVVAAAEDGADTKEFDVTVVEDGAERFLRLQAPDAETAKKWIAFIDAAIKPVVIENTDIMPAVAVATTGAAVMSADAPSPIAGASGELAIRDVDKTIEVSASVDDLPLPIVGEGGSVSKPAAAENWFWGMCCSAE